MSDLGTAYNPAHWSSFFSAQASASAALTGLLFVAISINLQKIVALPQLAARAAKALATLAAVLLISTFCLVPGQTTNVVGAEIVAVGAVAWIGITLLHLSASKNNPYISRGHWIFQFILAQSASLPVVLGGISLLLSRGGGLYWLVAGIVASFIAGLVDAWVLLIEIQR